MNCRRGRVREGREERMSQKRWLGKVRERSEMYLGKKVEKILMYVWRRERKGDG